MKWLRWAIATVSFAVVLGVALWEAEELTSPGPLHGSHEGIAELEAAAGCAACHGEGDATMADACGECHRVVVEQIEQRRGLHGTLEGTDPGACGRCHREHTGGMVPLVSELAFHTAGVPDVSGYDHRHVAAYTLVGRHRDLACHECHAQADAVVLAAGEVRYLGLSQQCTSCHDDPHHGDLGADCQSCHGQSESFDRVASFEHDSSFALEGVHAGHACVACHEAGSAHSVETLRGGGGVATRACADCHGSYHREGFIAGIAAIAAQPEHETCSLCHLVEHGTFGRPTAAMPRELHAATGFALEVPHRGLECVACHEEHAGPAAPAADPATDPATAFAARFPGRAPDDCAVCHGDPHSGQFGAGADQAACVACHDRAHFVPSTFGPEEHGRGRFPLTGAHQAVACQGCHQVVDGQRRFVPTPVACDQCHDDAHGGQFDGKDMPVEVEGRRGCARCHDTASFRESRLTGADHGLWTDYPLVGGHAAASCTDCHRRRNRPDERGRTFGVAPRECAECHQDPHAGQFLEQGRNDCERCHTAERPFARHRFDHQRGSRFALDEHHDKLACSACHKPVRVPGGGGAVVRYRPLGIRCEDCHDSRRFRVPSARRRR